MMHAHEAKVEWNSAKKQWQVVIPIGAEVIKRWLPKNPKEAGEETLRSLAVATAKDEGYELEVGQVSVVR